VRGRCADTGDSSPQRIPRFAAVAFVVGAACVVGTTVDAHNEMGENVLMPQHCLDGQTWLPALQNIELCRLASNVLRDKPPFKLPSLTLRRNRFRWCNTSNVG
jgi:hypothetical protein